ncbi:hypothetical protein [Microscilla marina]|nr:hypothetical protein [Microscilla marina]
MVQYQYTKKQQFGGYLSISKVGITCSLKSRYIVSNLPVNLMVMPIKGATLESKVGVVTPFKDYQILLGKTDFFEKYPTCQVFKTWQVGLMFGK